MLAVVAPPQLALIDGAAAASATDRRRQRCGAGLAATHLIFRPKKKNIQNPATLCISSRYSVKLRPRSSPLLAPRKPFSVTPPSPDKNTTTTTTTTTSPSVDTIPWTPELSSALYRVDGWGRPYFSVNSSGNINVHPYGSQTLPHQQIDLLDVVNSVAVTGSSSSPLPLPVLIQFPDVLKHRLESLQSAFDLAILSHGYRNRYKGVFPVKTNHNRHVVDDIVRFGSPFRFGLEAGSKPELLLAMSSLCKENYLNNPDALLVCNGFKDREYVSLSLAARELLGLDTVVVLEQEDELDLVVEVSRQLGVLRPVIGVRAKMKTAHTGHFGSTSGENGKFGLGAEQILRVVKRLESLGMLDCLQLLHFHIGSQIPSAEVVADVVSEGAHIYSELVRLGATSMRLIDVGGGLGIDYDGSKSTDSDISVGYTLQEYADAVVRTVKSVCDKKGVAHPVIVSESGRAIVSHHSVLVFEAFSSTTNTNTTTTRPTPSSIMSSIREGLSEEGWRYYHSLWSAALNGDYGTSVYYADRLKQRCVDQFKDGSLSIDQLAAVDALYDDLVSRAHRLGVNDNDDDDDNPSRIRTYNVNLSIFNSIPDFWAIGQLFPIIPIHRLDQRPEVKGILSDLTCDSDGKIDKFISGGSSLMLHKVGKNSKYYLGMFLGGAYQEALGGLHNLFGGPSVVRVTQKKIGGGGNEWPHHNFAVTRAVPGPSCGEVLRAMQHEPPFMFKYIKHRAEELMKLAHHHHLGLGNGNGNGHVFAHHHHHVGPGVLLDRVARSFNQTPYLDLGGGGIDLVNSNNGTYCSDTVCATTGRSEGTVDQEVDDELPNV